MNMALTMGLAKRMLGLLDRRETDLAPAIMYEPTEVYTSPERQQRAGHGLRADALFLA